MKAGTLKKSILQYAMQGKLVEQNPDDEPASELLKRIKVEKEQLIKDGKIKKEKPLPPIAEDEIPFELPQGWEWVRLSSILNKICAGGDKPQNFTTVKTNKNIYPVIANGETNLGILGYSDVPIIKERSLTVSGRGTMGFVCLREPNYIPIVRLLVLVPNSNIDICFLKYLLTYLSETGMGTAVKQLTVPMLSPKLIPIPPLAEQQRIVETLEQLFPLVEEYGKNEEKLTELNKTLPDKIKQSVLQHAVQGKLVPQNPADEPVSELLKRIKSEKEQLIKEGKIKKEKPLPPITDDEIPFELPQGWEWVRLGEIGNWGSGSTPNKARFDYYKNGTIPWLKTGDLNDGYIDSIPERITELALKETSVKLKPAGSLLIAMYGATIGKLGILNIEATTNQACCACIKYSNLNTKFLFYYLLSERDNLRKMGEGGAQPNISREKLIYYLMPLPPLAEQKRIVDKVEELMSIVDGLTK